MIINTIPMAGAYYSKDPGNLHCKCLIFMEREMTLLQFVHYCTSQIVNRVV